MIYCRWLQTYTATIFKTLRRRRDGTLRQNTGGLRWFLCVLFVLRWIYTLLSFTDADIILCSYLIQEWWILLLRFITLIVIHLSNCVSKAILIVSLDVVNIRHADWGLFVFLSMSNCYFYKCQKVSCFHRIVTTIVDSRAAKCESYFSAFWVLI